MPIIEVHMLSGRSVETRAELIANLTRATCETLHCPAENVRIILQEMRPENFGKAGKPYPGGTSQNP